MFSKRVHKSDNARNSRTSTEVRKVKQTDRSTLWNQSVHIPASVCPSNLNTIILASARLVGKGDRTLVRRQHLCPYAHCGGTGRRHNTYQPSVGLTSDPVITLARWEKEAVQYAGANDTVAPILSDIGKITRKTNCNSVTHVRKLRCNKKKQKNTSDYGFMIIHKAAVNHQ